MIRVVIDTNVLYLVSAMISPSGNEALLLLAVKQGLIKPCFSPAVLEEYSEVLARPKFVFPPDEITALIDLLQRQGTFYTLPLFPVFLAIARMTSSWPALWRQRPISWLREISGIFRRINLELPMS